MMPFGKRVLFGSLRSVPPDYAALVLAEGEAHLHLPLPREALRRRELDALVVGVEVVDVVANARVLVFAAVLML